MTRCPHCDATLEGNAPRFCASCGRPTGAEAGAGRAAAAEPRETVLFEGRPAVIPGVGALLLAVLTVGIAVLFFWMRSLGRHYKITSERIVIEQGVFSKRTEQIDLYRITDYVVERPFGQRLLGTGNLVIQAMDRTTPLLHVQAIKTDVMALYERLRVATEKEKRRRGVRVVDFDEDPTGHAA